MATGARIAFFVARITRVQTQLYPDDDLETLALVVSRVSELKAVKANLERDNTTFARLREDGLSARSAMNSLGFPAETPIQRRSPDAPPYPELLLGRIQRTIERLEWRASVIARSTLHGSLLQ